VRSLLKGARHRWTWSSARLPTRPICPPVSKLPVYVEEKPARVMYADNVASVNSDYQSMGRCHDNCTALDYPLAIVQLKSCWCSNLIPNPANQKSLGNCHNPCPGYPDDFCGGSGTYGYISLPVGTIKGTAPAGSTNTKTSSSVRLNLPPVRRHASHVLCDPVFPIFSEGLCFGQSI